MELRKKGRDDQLLKRRNIDVNEEAENEQNEINANTAAYGHGGKTLPTLEEIVGGREKGGGGGGGGGGDRHAGGGLLSGRLGVNGWRLERLEKDLPNQLSDAR